MIDYHHFLFSQYTYMLLTLITSKVADYSHLMKALSAEYSADGMLAADKL